MRARDVRPQMTQAMEAGMKRDINAPCVAVMHGVPDIDGKHKSGAMYPGVNCELNCYSCGWNPIERRRRMQTGKFEPVKAYIGPKGEPVHVENCVQLKFVRREKI